jgi:hypothetical protein
MGVAAGDRPAADEPPAAGSRQASRCHGWRRVLVLAVLLVGASVGHWDQIRPRQPIDYWTDRDGLHKLQGIAADPSLKAALGYFVGDDPQHVKTFRPLPAFTLWIEWHLWGFTRWPYQVMNLAWLALTALALVSLGRALGLAAAPAWAAGLALLAMPSMGSRIVVLIVATRHDLTCVLFSILAVRSLLGYLDDGRRRWLASYAACSLLAYLSKEMAVVLVPMGLALVAADWRRGPHRALAAAGVTVAVAAVWYAWYLYAQTNMAAGGFTGHSFGDLVHLLRRRWRNSLMLYEWQLCPPLGSLRSMLLGAPSLDLLIYGRFWRSLVRLVLFATVVVVAWRRQRRVLGVVFLWKLVTYLPVLPLNLSGPWHRYMPHVLDPLLAVAAAWAIAAPPSGEPAAGRLRRRGA